MKSLLFIGCLLSISAHWNPDAAIEKRAVDATPNPCTEQPTCGSCIAKAAECGWCQQEGFDARGRGRCDLTANLREASCPESNITGPDNSVTSIQDEEVRNAVPSRGDPAIQLQPQKMSLKLRPNKPYKFDLHFRLAENYPVDLYYVLDLSHSMNDDKKNLAKLGGKLAAEMEEITNNFHLGFGTFVDKKTMPFVSVVPDKLISPCEDCPTPQTCYPCAAPYGFRNEMPLTDQTRNFGRLVNETRISGNLDKPEGGFDAIMQAVVCSDEIGWRPDARKLLVFATDASFHLAGDGKLGGIVKPNDGACHLEDGLYSESLNQDYPSISHLSYKVAENKINIIFAVTKEQVSIYTALSEFMEGSTAGQLEGDGSNVVDLIKDNYEKISSVVEMKTEGSSDVLVRFKSACLGSDVRDVSKCTDLHIGESVEFEVEIEVTECPADPSEWQKNLTLYAVGLNEKLELTIDLICECGCEQAAAEERSSPRCHSNGTYECGSCTCDEGFYGRECECALDSNTPGDIGYETSCKMTNQSDTCEGSGQCVCGQCHCDAINYQDNSKRYSGKFCECNDFACDQDDSKLCGGNGQCKCGICQCNSGYNGSACQCPISQKPCRAANGLLCNGQGSCQCGKCVCNAGSNFHGRACEECPTCPARCNAHKACAQCVAFSSGPYSQAQCTEHCSTTEIVDGITAAEDVRRICQFRDDDDCLFSFSYEYEGDVVQVVDAKECPEPVNILLIVLGVVGGIVGAGILLLIIWKIYATVQDKREMAKFEKEKANAKWDTGMNPIYKQATSTVQNPMYNK